MTLNATDKRYETRSKIMFISLSVYFFTNLVIVLIIYNIKESSAIYFVKYFDIRPIWFSVSNSDYLMKYTATTISSVKLIVLENGQIILGILYIFIRTVLEIKHNENKSIVNIGAPIFLLIQAVLAIIPALSPAILRDISSVGMSYASSDIRVYIQIAFVTSGIFLLFIESTLLLIISFRSWLRDRSENDA